MFKSQLNTLILNDIIIKEHLVDKINQKNKILSP